MNVKLGHRRVSLTASSPSRNLINHPAPKKLQREIANHRGIPYECSLGSPALESGAETARVADSPTPPTSVSERAPQGGSEQKRKYKRHPKPDENAPQRPPSSYVIFSNEIREEVRGQNMTFTDIAKLVGERWQKLSPAGKEPYESRATALKQKYNSELAEYRKTDACKEYQKYLADFRAKHWGAPTEGKRPKLEQESSGGSTSTKSEIAEGHTRTGSIGSTASLTPIGTMASSSPSPGYLGSSVPTRLPPMPPSADYPISSILPREPRPQATLSTTSSVSEESVNHRDPDLLPGTAQLSLLPGPTRSGDLHLQSTMVSGLGRAPNACRRQSGVRMSLDTRHSGESRSGGSVFSSLSGPGDSFVLPSPQIDDQRRVPLWDLSNPALQSNLPTAQGGILASPPVAPERLPDILKDPSQRALPLPGSSPPHEGLGHRNVPRLPAPATPRQPVVPGLGVSVLAQEGSRLNRSESEAADTLAGLAYGGGPGEMGRRKGGIG